MLIQNELLSLCARILVGIATIVVTMDNISWIKHLGFGILLESMCMVIIVLAMAFLFSFLSRVFYIAELKRLSNKFDNSKKIYDARVKLRDVQDMLLLKEDWWDSHKTNEIARTAKAKSALVCACAILVIGFKLLS